MDASRVDAAAAPALVEAFLSAASATAVERPAAAYAASVRRSELSMSSRSERSA
jgi:hypothetical protein